MKALENYGAQAMGIGFMVEPDQAMVWRCPLATQALDRLLHQTARCELNYRIIDMPPGTGGTVGTSKAIARQAAVKIAIKAKDSSAKFPTISVSKAT